MASLQVTKLAEQVIGAMKPAAPGADPVLQQRTAVVLRHLLAAVEEVGLTEEELGRFCGFLDRVAGSGEWRFLTHVFGVDVLVTEMAHGGTETATADNVEGPLYRAGSPQVSTPATLMRADEPGDRLFLSGRVFDRATGHPVAGAVIDVWQSNAAGAYAEDDPTQPEWNFRRCVIADGEGRYEIETVVPGCYQIGDLSGMACGDMMRRLGRHGMRPGHVHFKLSGAGVKPMTSMLYFDGDPWLDDDSIFSVREDVTVEPVRHDDPADIRARGLNAPFMTATFDFQLEPVGADTPAVAA